MSYHAYLSYKDSATHWLGQIPSAWEVGKLGQFFIERREKVSDKDFEPLSVTKEGIVPQLENAAKTDAGDNRKKVCKGDFVINSRSDRKGSSGVSDQDGSVSLISIVLQPRGIDHSFVHYLLRSYPFQEEFFRYGRGIVADLWSTTYSAMKNIIIPVPSKFEQSAIANFLDQETAKIDTLIAKQQQLIETLQEKRQTLITDSVMKGLAPDVSVKNSNIEWLGNVPSEWTVAALRRVLNSIEQGWSPPAENREAPEDEWAVLKISAVKKGQFFESENKALLPATEPIHKYEVNKGDLLMTRGNTPELVGDVCIVTTTRAKLMLSDLIYRISLLKSHIDPKWANYWLLSNAGRQQIEAIARGSSQSMVKISQEHIKSFIILLPPLTVQDEIVVYLDQQTKKIDYLIVKANETILLLQERRTSLISAAVTGKIDVRAYGNHEP